MSLIFSWLHLSDLHLRQSTAWDSDQVTSGLLADLARAQKENGFRPDAIFFTGDAVFGRVVNEDISEQYKKFGNFLDIVRKAFVPEIEKCRLYIVPGNHDVDRAEILDSDTEWLRSPSRNEEEIYLKIEANDPMFRHWIKRLDSYRSFLRDYGLNHLNPQEPSLTWFDTLQIEGKKIAISGFNSAWSCSSNKEKSLLWMGGRWQIGKAVSQFNGHDFSIALVHHPSNWLTEYEDPIFGQKLASNFDIILHGHEHRVFFEQDVSGRMKISAGACYDHPKDPKAYSYGVISLDKPKGKLYLRAWDDLGEGWVAKNISGKTENGAFDLANLALYINSDSSLDFRNSQSLEKSKQIISLTGSPSEEAVEQKVSRLIRRPYVFQEPHSRIRKKAQSELEELLLSDRIAWVAADWQMGKEGFIASVLNSIGSSQALDNVYRIDCNQFDEVEDIFEESGAQLGVAFVEFATLVEHLGQVTLVLEDYPSKLIKDTVKRGELAQKLDATLKFTRNLRIIIVSRHWPNQVHEVKPISLTPVDLEDLRRYLAAHPGARELLRRKDRLEEIHEHVGGLPVALDRLISQSALLDLDSLLDNAPLRESDTLAEAVPLSLKSAVARVFAAQTDDEKRKLNLLKLLTVLKDGETYEALRKAFPRKPFWPEHFISLSEDGLMESIPVSSGASSFLPVTVSRRSDLQSSDRMLRVPRQVREHVESMLGHDEKIKIFNSISEAFFGAQWYQGKIRLRPSIVLAYRESNVSGPGNELLVAQYLLKVAIDRGNKYRIVRYSCLAVDFCSALFKPLPHKMWVI